MKENLLIVHKSSSLLSAVSSPLQAREKYENTIFFVCVWNSALDGLRDSSLSSFFQLYVGNKKSFYILCVFFSFSTMKHSHENVKRFRNILFTSSSCTLSYSLFYKHINMLNRIHIIFLFLEGHLLLFVYLFMDFFYISSSYNISLL